MDADRTVTVGVRGLVLTAVVTAAVVVAYLLGGGDDSAPAAAATPPSASDTPRTLTMVGSGTVTAIPDQLTFALSVRVTRTDLDDSLQGANATIGRVFDALKDYGVSKADLQTTGLSMDPVYTYPAYSAPVLQGYRVSERARVLVEDLKLGGKAISAAIAAGGNAVRVSDIALKVSDAEEAMAGARRAAVAAATAKATEYAESAGQSLGEVLTLREVSASRPVPAPTYSLARMAADSAALSAVPIKAGEQDLKVTVQVVWEFA